MAEATATRKKKSAGSRSSLRIVLFGPPQAGKTSLLAALALVADTQSQALAGRFHALDDDLLELKHRLANGTLLETSDEIVPYHVVFQPHSSMRAGVVLFDCDGRAANELLRQKRQLDGRDNGALGKAILGADAVILAVDASAGPHQIESEFREFDQFLKCFEHSRGKQIAVGGLPVFLVLTKCDLLARPGDSRAAWLDRIEECKSRVGKRFNEFLQHSSARGVPFGSIRLQLWATAIKRPALAEQASDTREPYGVAELFQQCFASAERFRRRARIAGRRLLVTAAGSFLFIAALAGLAVALLLSRPAPTTTKLEQDIRRFKLHEEELSPRARNQRPLDKLSQLRAFAEHKDFPNIHDEYRDYIRDRIKELEAYRIFADKLNQVPDPAEARTERELDAIRQKLDAITPPSEYAELWSQSQAMEFKQTMLKEIEAMKSELARIILGYDKLVRDGRKVLDESKKPMLPARAKKVVDYAKTLPSFETDYNKTIQGSQRIRYGVLFEFDDVRRLLKEWQTELKEPLELAASLLPS
ncbi:MAG: hypothetical protein KatS3mg105_3948 [Gemmatales bacterium]|nr:MAG: hypothetical protein KatS3mg105_3948 [Gemmatales bacterium]